MRKNTKESDLNTEPLGQNLIKLISNLCFSVFVLSVLIFTVIAITYQPPDPWLQSAPSLTNLFTQTENATFKNDDSIVRTGEDLLSGPAPAMPPTDDLTVKTGEDLLSGPHPAMPPTNDSTVKTGEDLLSGPTPAMTPTNDSIVKTGEDLLSVPAPAMPPTDDSIVKTGEDLLSVPAPAMPPTDDSIVKTGENLLPVPAPAVAPTNDSIVKTGEDLLSIPAPAMPPTDDSIVKTGENLLPVPASAVAPTNDSIVKTGEDLLSIPAPAMPPTDDSIVKTGDDLLPAPAPAMPPALAMAPESITKTVIEKSKEKISNSSLKSDCEELKIVNCSDPGVLLAVKRFNLKTFKSIVFFEYGIPVNGTEPDECDVGWRYRNKKEKSWRKYRDFRRFKFGFGENCTYKVVHTGRFHSGINARPSRSKLNTTKSGGGSRDRKPKLARPIRDDEINDTIPTLGSEINFRKGRYLYYARGGDHCKGMNQYLWSFLCGLGEAMYLNRTFVMDLNLCLPKTYSSSNKDEEGKDFRFYFDFEHLKETASIVEESEFLRDWKKWDKGHKRKVPVKKVKTHRVTPMQLKKEKSTVIWRQFDGQEPENDWYRVCEGQAARYIHRPWQALWKSKRLMNIVTEISGRMDWDFDALHVVRGEKAKNKQLWPHLDSDTSPDSVLIKLKQMVQPWRNLYIATNEPFYNYFDNLRSYYKVHLLDDYNELWSDTSEWYNETTTLNGGKPVEFDGYMRVAVDTEVLYRAKTRVETFYNLTKDCKDGINTC